MIVLTDRVVLRLDVAALLNKNIVGPRQSSPISCHHSPKNIKALALIPPLQGVSKFDAENSPTPRYSYLRKI